jgi:hypothetical protein
MLSFLAENPSKLAAWASVEGISSTEVPAYVRGLTSVLLRTDTWVTNHGYSGSHATTLSSVLQAGTAVMVDSYGVPRVKCFCGNPLTAPTRYDSTPRYTGTPWIGFSPTSVVVIQASITVVTSFTIVDVDTGKPFLRGPTGDATASGRPPTSTPPPSSTTTTTAPASTTSTGPPTSAPTSGPAVAGTYDVQYPPSATGTCPEAPPATLIVARSGGSLSITAQSSQFTDQLTGPIDGTLVFDTHGTRQIGGGLGLRMVGQFAAGGSGTVIQAGQLTFSGPSGPCTFEFTATRRP